MSSAKPTKTVDFQQQLECIPLRNRSVRIVENTTDRLVLAVKLDYRGPLALAARLLKLAKEKKYCLDGLGRRLYQAVDSKSTVEQLVDDFKIKYRLGFLEARALVTHYLQVLLRHGLIVVVIPEQRGP